MKENTILKNKFYLYLTNFFAGMSIMAVELAASRLLAPYFSSSQIVWTIIIGTIMIALALGNIYGGRSADKDPNPDRMYMRLIIAGIWIAAIPVFGKYIILLISGILVFTINTNILTIAAFIVCIVIFAFPLFLLGTVTPSLIKYTVESLKDNGKTVGLLGASNTIGCILGTFLPTFVTIPAVGTSITFLIFSGVLLLLSFVYFIANKTKKVKCIVAAALFIIFSFLGNNDSFAFWEKNLTYEGESIYNYLQVKEDENKVYLSTNVLFGVQSVLVKDGSLTGMYYDYAMAAPLMQSINKDLSKTKLLILGMGSGTYAKQCINYLDIKDITGVEIDQKITDLANKYFELPKEVKVATYDARAYLYADDNAYDIIMVDAYQDITIPFQMSSVEFFMIVKDKLKKDGIMVVNMNMHTNTPKNINEYLSDTIASVFSEVYIVDVEGSTNRLLFASLNDEIVDNFENNIDYIKDYSLKSHMESVLKNIEPYKSGELLLTDDKAPVEVLGIKVIDEIIRKEVVYYKEVLKTKGIKGLLE